MLEYRENATVEEEQPVAPAVPRYMSLAQQYGIGDEMRIGRGSQAGGHQTVQQEYHLYISTRLSLETIDILKFWEVDCIIPHFF